MGMVIGHGHRQIPRLTQATSRDIRFAGPGRYFSANLAFT